MTIWIEALGWCGTIVLVVSLMQTRMRRLRRLGLVACTILVAYNAILEVWPMVAMNLAIAVINVYHLVRHTDRTGHDGTPRTEAVG